MDGRYHDTFSCEKKMLVFSAPTLGSRRLMVGEASPSVFGCHPLKRLSSKKKTLRFQGVARGALQSLGCWSIATWFLPTDVVVRRQACECEFYFFGREKVVARMLGPFLFPLGSFDVDFGGGFR